MNVLIVDDHVLFRQGLIFLLSELDETLQFHQAGSSAQALDLCEASKMDLVLLDLHLPGEEKLANFDVLKTSSGAPIVVLSSEDNPLVIRHAIETGASGFVPKSATPEVLIAALKLILAGGIYLPPNVLNAAPNQVEIPAQTEEEGVLGGALKNLSARQLEVLVKAVQGKANKVIARELHLSEGTVKAHLSSSYRALGVSNRTEAVYAAAEMGLNVSPR